MLSEKQIKSINESNKKINIWEGSVRSGKSFAALIRFLKELEFGPEGEYTIVGVSQDTLKRNVIAELIKLLGTDAKYYSGKRELMIYGKKIHLIGASDERAERRIRGPTFSGALVDELTLIPEEVIKTLVSRLSIQGSKLFATTNPDSPFHFVKKEYIDSNNSDIYSIKFLLEDNPSLPRDYVEFIKKTYQGLWYKRFIEGEWCLAEGAIYDFFDESRHCIDFTDNSADYYIVGVDYGTTNPTAFTLIGYNPTVYPNLWVEKEYYYDSVKEFRQKTDAEFADDLKKFIDGHLVKYIYIDPAAESFKVECKRSSISNIFDGKNDVLDGIRFVSSLLISGTVKICRCCKNLIEEFESYSWDQKSRNTGKDKPLKKNDHCFGAGTLIQTDIGEIPIEKINNQKVLTPVGYKKILTQFTHFEDIYEYNILGKRIKCTKDHKFYTLNGWKESSNLIHSDMFLINILGTTCHQNVSFLTESNIENTYHPKIGQIENIIERINQIVLKDTDISIEIFGNSIMEKYPKDIIYITSTEIPKTMTLAISNLLHLLNTYPIIKKILLKNKKKIEDYIAKELDRLAKNGINQKKVKNGIQNMSKIQLEKSNPPSISVNNAMQNITLKSNKDQNFVRINVNQNGEEQISLMMNIEYALFAIRNLKQINTLNHYIADDPVLVKYIGKEKVYNLHVEGMHVYYAENILVSNCLDSLRYALFTHFGQNLGEENRMTKEMLKSLKRKHLGEF